MDKTDKEVLELCKLWFEDIMERCDRLTSGNVSHGSRAIHGVAKNYAEYIDEYLENTRKSSDEQMMTLKEAVDAEIVEVEDSNNSMYAYTHLEICTDEDLSKICKAGDKAKVIIIKQK